MVAEPEIALQDTEHEVLDLWADLNLPSIRKTCPKCGGHGRAPDQIPDADGGDVDPCSLCHGAGEVDVPQIISYDHALSLAEALAAITRQERERWEAFERRIARLEMDREAALSPLRKRREFLEWMLTDYHKRLLAADKRAKTVPLSSGVKLQSRHVQRWLYNDEALTDWLRQHAPDYVRVKYEPAKADLKKVAKPLPDGRVVLDSGEVVEGIQVTDETTFTVKVDLNDA